ncbi:MAG: aspartyl/asparaginyl beta-hydroxylase domain-containing protein [Gammaproteobacteria bacterium]|nr:aspartyl/asparaginyl beta-hydroxylase domain-containing protein [Gammaproteobacteria bacterium]MDH3536304.1 aspartyl/asparaginyl beta-hydroxylase domain-containing protein [Gammaproteobacteria bacterium]
MQASENSRDAVKLPLRFDPNALREDLGRIPEERWIRHFVTDNYEGDWSGVALRGPANVTHPIQELFANPGTEAWANTSLYDECPYFAEVMSTFQCNLLSVRLLRLGPGSIIKEHVDHSLSLEDAELRLHVPVQTNAEIEFWLDDKLVPLEAGETWYLNVNRPHRVENNSDEYRVHLVLDCEINSWLRAQAGFPV